MDRIFERIGTFLWKYRIVVQASILSIVSYSTALLTMYVKSKSVSDDSWLIVIIGAFAVVFVMTLISISSDKILKKFEKAQEREHNIHKTGYVTLSRELNNYIKILRELSDDATTRLGEIPVRLMKNAVSELYDTLEAEYGSAGRIEEHIEFEVTFMTTSLRDGKITIAAWGSRDGRAPKSLTKRDIEPEIYSGTETAKLYEDINRSIRVVERTTGSDYKELYPGQKSRIRSSIIYPVLDDVYTLWGTLVVHCDKDGFFKGDSVKFWKELFEPYTKRLALARIAADKLSERSQRQWEF
jgi:hypothetical protein